MFKKNQLRFASQPDDYQSEKLVMEKFKPEKALLWANGGDNFLNLSGLFNDVSFDAFDSDLAEIEHLKSKISCLKRSDFEHMNLEHNDQHGLNQSGRYESLLRILRRYFFEFVVEHEAFEGRFWSAEKEEKQEILKQVFSHPAWDRAFAMFFSKPSLEALIGGHWAEDSCLHVRKNVENLLLRDDSSSNPFLKHLFLGEYDQEAKPEYFSLKPNAKVSDSEFFVNHLWDIPIETYQFLSLGAYFDFLAEEQKTKAVNYLKENLEKGSVLVIRSLREKTDFLDSLEPEFYIDRSWGEELLRKDRSFLFSHMIIAIKE
jgi:hypothetical protein